jgi:hypothetical protein
LLVKEEAAVELVDPGRKLDAQPMRARCERPRECECRRLGRGIERDVGALRDVVGGDGSKRRVDGVERQPRRRLAHLDVDHFDAGKREALRVGSQLDGIADRNDCLRQLARRGVEGENRLGSHRSCYDDHHHDHCAAIARQGCRHDKLHTRSCRSRRYKDKSYRRVADRETDVSGR